MAEITTTQPSPQHWFGMAYLLIFVAGIGFFLLSFIALGVLPGLRLADVIASHTQTDMPDYTAAELRGRQVYASLGCALCHTQQVRFVLSDVLRWGAPTEAWETRYDFPQLWGTRRIGPDLAREAGVRSDDWQLTHLYHPQSIVPDSVMPSYDWLFKGSPDRPGASAADLLAYLHTLGRARQAGAGKRIGPRFDSGLDPDMLMEIKSLCTAPFINANQAQLNATTPSLAHIAATHDQLFARGSMLFTQNCAGCHGANGDGNGLAASGLSPRPANLRLHQFTTQGVVQALWNGVPGSAMPAWRDLPVSDLASLTIYVQTLHSAPVETTPATASVLARGAGIYANNCMSCHGAQGRGNSSVGMLLLPRPADFTAMQLDATQAIQVLNTGIPGTAMPPWTSLSSPDKQAVSAFIRTLYKLPEGQKP